MNLRILDVLFTILHLVIIGFNLLGWIWKPTRKAHYICILLTAICWFVLGIWFGIGYCPITDWQWQIKEKLGEQNLPNSFIKYYADQLSGKNLNASFIDAFAAICFFLAALLSVYVNFFKTKSKK